EQGGIADQRALLQSALSVLSGEIEQTIVSGGVPVDYVEIRPGGGGQGDPLLGWQFAVGRQLGPKTFVVLNAGFCEGRQVGVRNTLGLSMQFRFSPEWRTEASFEPVQTCADPGTESQGGTVPRQVGLDLFWAKRDWWSIVGGDVARTASLNGWARRGATLKRGVLQHSVVPSSGFSLGPIFPGAHLPSVHALRGARRDARPPHHQPRRGAHRRARGHSDPRHLAAWRLVGGCARHSPSGRCPPLRAGGADPGVRCARLLRWRRHRDADRG